MVSVVQTLPIHAHLSERAGSSHSFHRHLRQHFLAAWLDRFQSVCRVVGSHGWGVIRSHMRIFGIGRIIVVLRASEFESGSLQFADLLVYGRALGSLWCGRFFKIFAVTMSHKTALEPTCIRNPAAGGRYSGLKC